METNDDPSSKKMTAYAQFVMDDLYGTYSAQLFISVGKVIVYKSCGGIFPFLFVCLNGHK